MPRPHKSKRSRRGCERQERRESTLGRYFGARRRPRRAAPDPRATSGGGKDVAAAGGGGPLVEAACQYIERYGKPVVIVRTGKTTVGACGAVSATGAPTGTSVVTEDAAPAPYADYAERLDAGLRGA